MRRRPGTWFPSDVPSHITRVLQDRRPIRGRNPDVDLTVPATRRTRLLDTRRLAENAGFIAKPFTAESLTRKVGELLGR